MAELADEMERAGAWSGTRTLSHPEVATQKMLIGDPAWPDLLNLLLELPDDDPFRLLRRRPAATVAIAAARNAVAAARAKLKL